MTDDREPQTEAGRRLRIALEGGLHSAPGLTPVDAILAIEAEAREAGFLAGWDGGYRLAEKREAEARADAAREAPDPRVEALREALRKAREALRLTQEYVGDGLLPPLPGWSWFDGIAAIDAALATPPANDPDDPHRWDMCGDWGTDGCPHAPPPAGIDFRCPRCGFMVDSPMHTESCARLAPQPTADPEEVPNIE